MDVSHAQFAHGLFPGYTGMFVQWFSGWGRPGVARALVYEGVVGGSW